MIYIDKDEISIIGSGIDIAAEISCVIHSIVKRTPKESRPALKKLMYDSVNFAFDFKESAEEENKESEEASEKAGIEDILEELFKTIFAKGK